MTKPNEIDEKALEDAISQHLKDNRVWPNIYDQFDESEFDSLAFSIMQMAKEYYSRASAKSCHSGVATQEQLIRGARAIGNSMNELNHINRAKEIWDAFHTDKDVPIPISPHLSTQKDNTHIYK